MLNYVLCLPGVATPHLSHIVTYQKRSPLKPRAEGRLLYRQVSILHSIELS